MSNLEAGKAAVHREGERPHEPQLKERARQHSEPRCRVTALTTRLVSRVGHRVTALSRNATHSGGNVAARGDAIR